MKILFCIPMMSNRGGGAERVLALVANGLALRGHDVGICSLDQPGEQSFYPLDPKVRWHAIGARRADSNTAAFDFLSSAWSLRREVRRLSPDLVVGFLPSAFIPLGIAMFASRTPLVASEHIVWQHYASRPLQALAMYSMRWAARRITCVSEQARSTFPTALQRKMDVIPNPVAIDRDGQADVIGQPGAPHTLLAVGRLVPQKDHATLIEAFAILKDRFADWQLRIVGEGEMRPGLERLVAERDLQDCVTLAGTKEDIRSEYLAAQLFVLPSRYESLGLTTVEALTYGLPAVGFSDCPGTNQLIKPGLNGELVDGGGDRVAALAEVLADLMGSPEKRAALAGHAPPAPSSWCLDSVLDRWEELLRSVS